MTNHLSKLKVKICTLWKGHNGENPALKMTPEQGSYIYHKVFTLKQAIAIPLKQYVEFRFRLNRLKDNFKYRFGQVWSPNCKVRQSILFHGIT